MKQKISLKVDKQGNATILDVTGAGANCQETSKGLENALGMVDEKSREMTSSFYQDVDPLKLTATNE